MLKSVKGKIIVQQFSENEEAFISVPDRKLLVKIACQWFQQTVGLYPTTEQKTEMAAAIVSAFPCLGIKEGEDVKHDHYFHPKAGGFLETRLKTLRKCLPLADRKRKAANSNKQTHRKVKPKGHHLDKTSEFDCELAVNQPNIEQINFKVEKKFMVLLFSN